MNGWDEQRICYKYNYVSPEDTIHIRIPKRRDNGQIESDTSLWESEHVSYEDIYSVLYIYDQFAVKVPTFELLMMKAVLFDDMKRREICPIGLMTEKADRLMWIESMCEKYRIPPYPGGSLQEQPPWIIEAFTIISIAKDRYNTRKIELEKAKHGKKGR